MSAFGALFGHHDTVSGMSYHEVITDAEMQAATSAWGHSRRLRHVRLRSGLGTIPDIFADDCRTNLSALK